MCVCVGVRSGALRQVCVWVGVGVEEEVCEVVKREL